MSTTTMTTDTGPSDQANSAPVARTLHYDYDDGPDGSA